MWHGDALCAARWAALHNSSSPRTEVECGTTHCIYRNLWYNNGRFFLLVDGPAPVVRPSDAHLCCPQTNDDNDLSCTAKLLAAHDIHQEQGTVCQVVFPPPQRLLSSVLCASWMRAQYALSNNGCCHAQGRVLLVPRTACF